MTTEIQRAWQHFLEVYEPLRSELYRYCRYLTRSPWDSEDLTQDTLARGFATLARRGEVPISTRAWLFRITSNLWIDQMRRRREVPLCCRALRFRAGASLSRSIPSGAERGALHKP